MPKQIVTQIQHEQVKRAKTSNSFSFCKNDQLLVYYNALLSFYYYNRTYLSIRPEVIHVDIGQNQYQRIYHRLTILTIRSRKAGN